MSFCGAWGQCLGSVSTMCSNEDSMPPDQGAKRPTSGLKPQVRLGLEPSGQQTAHSADSGQCWCLESLVFMALSMTLLVRTPEATSLARAWVEDRIQKCPLIRPSPGSQAEHRHHSQGVLAMVYALSLCPPPSVLHPLPSAHTSHLPTALCSPLPHLP